MKAGIYINKNHLSENKPYLERIRRSLEKSGINCKVVYGLNDLEGIEVLFVLGGDGTILTVASACAKSGIKILGINRGHLGFLTEFQPEEIDEAIDLVCGGNYTVLKRNMLEVISGKNVFHALNDAVIQRSTSGNGFSNTVDLRAEIDGTPVDNYTADGIIISTPTGSTAYSLSAGGSILTPDINAFIMTPICAHSLHSRPVVYNDNSVLKIYPLCEKTPLNLIVDGTVVGELGKEDTVVIKKSDYFVEFITRGEKDFFNKLSVKLNIWSK
ncbi:MAG: NAD(+)/NADH kinase [Clostridia bacterium]|nr:NAD(+)/NADH kinase [Clostridia bacterium]